MAERPILFTSALVKAIMAGGKIQTRRVVTPATSLPSSRKRWEQIDLERAKRYDVPPNPKPALVAPTDPGWALVISRVRAGDTLWVREKHWVCELRGRGLGNRHLVYDDEIVGHYPEPAEDRPWLGTARWGPRPSIHMPRWASRLSLHVTSVRPQRLTDIPHWDIRNEGSNCPVHDATVSSCSSECPELRQGFAEGWDQINGKRAAWASNPWVWVISFRVIE